MDLFKLLGTIAVDGSEAFEAFRKTQQEGEKTENKLSKVFGAIGKGAVACGKVIASGLAVGATAMAGLTVKALNLSGELEQNMGGSEAVFGEYAESMQTKAKDASSKMGLSTSDYLATANKMGALFQGAGFSIEESMNLSSDAMQRAADVASIMGIDTESAMEAVAGAAKGNFTMMDNLGVAMNDTAIQNYALSKGINKTTAEMTQQEKIGLAMEMFMEKTAYAADNYAKENDTLAGSLNTAKAALTNFLDGSGDVDSLVSSFSNAATVIVESITEILPRLTTGLTDIIGKIVPLIPPLLQQILPAIIEGASSLISGLVAALPQVLSTLMDALPAVISGIQSIFEAVVTALPQLIETLVSALPGLIPQLIDGLVSMIVTLCTMIPQMIQPIIDNLPTIIIAIVNALMTNLPALVQGLVQLTVALVAMMPQIIQSLIDALPTILTSIVNGLFAAAPILWEGVKQIWNSLVDSVMAILDGLKNLLSSAWEALGNVPGLSTLKTMIEEVWGAISQHIGVVVDSIKNVISTAWESIKNVVSTVIDSIKNVISTVWESIKTIIANVMNIIFSVIKGDWESVRQSISNIINAIKNVISSVWNGIKNTISSYVNGIKNTVSSVFNGIKSTVSSVFNTIKSVATSVWNGIKTAMTKPIETAKEKIKGIVDAVKGFFTGMKLEFPNIKLPHFSIKPAGWKIGDLLEGSIPKLGIEWYAKAMNNPMIMTKPTIFGYDASTGQLMGGGESGTEVVSGADTLMKMISDAVHQTNSGGNEAMVGALNTVVVLLQDLLQAVLAGHVITINEREFGRTVREYA